MVDGTHWTLVCPLTSIKYCLAKEREMGEFMLFTGFLGFIVGLVMLIYSFIRRRSKRPAAIITAVAFCLFIVGAVILGSSEVATPPLDNIEQEIDSSSNDIQDNRYMIY
jgi:peptidoglycan/LPS O-acetylase OafA/YrhL